MLGAIAILLALMVGFVAHERQLRRNVHAALPTVAGTRVPVSV
jgi:hypothetical protein